MDLQQRGLSGRPRRQADRLRQLRDHGQGKNEVGVAYMFRTDQPLDELTFVYKTPGTIINASSTTN